MGVFEAIILAVVLSLDAFAVSLSIGMCQNPFTSFQRFRLLFIIGVFHFIMPVIGWALAGSVHTVVESYDHWFAFGLLAYLGVKMIREGIAKKSDPDREAMCSYSFFNSLMFGVALSIDAVIAGFSLGMTRIEIATASTQFVNMLIASAIIGICAFFITMLGLFFGRSAGSRLGQNAEIFGGSVLIFLGLKTLISHLIV